MINSLKGKKIPILRCKNKEETFSSVRLLSELGVSVVELTFSIPDVDTYLEELRSMYPNILFGIGTAYTKERAMRAINCGSAFIVSPNFSREISDLCQEYNVAYLPGCLTPSEVAEAFNSGNKLIKLFPSNLFGIGYLKTLKTLYPEIEFMCSGGINHENYLEWLQECNSVGIGGSYFDSIDEQNYDEKLEKLKFLKDVT